MKNKGSQQMSKISKKKTLGYSIGLLVAALVGINVYLANQNKSLVSEIAKLHKSTVATEVIDGDTLQLANGQRIRLSNLEAPELENCGGPEAKLRLKELVEGKSVRPEFIDVDRFRRSIGLVYIGKVLVNEVMLREGLARYDGTPTKERDKLKAAYDFAFSNRLGIFSNKCLSLEPDVPGCLIKGNISRKSKQDKTYHFPDCSAYDQVMVEKDLGESWFCSEKEAENAGYVKSENCFGRIFRAVRN